MPLNPTKLQPTDRYIPAGTRRIFSVPTIAAPTGIPTLAELNAGTEVTAEIPEDGVSGFMADSDDVKVGDYSTRNRGSIPGMGDLADSALKTYASRTSSDARQLWTDDLKTYIVVAPEGAALATNTMNIFQVRVKVTNVLNDAAGDPAVVETKFALQRVIKNIVIPQT